MATIDTLDIQITSDSSVLVRELDAITNALKGINKTNKNLTKLKANIQGVNNASKGLSNLSKITKAINFGGMLIGLNKLTDGIAKSVNSINDYVEDINLFKQTMGEFSQEAGDYAHELQDLMGIDASQFMRNQAVFMSMANGFGLAREQAYEMSKGLTELAYDFSSLYNVDIEEMFTKLQSAIAGEIEPIRRLGVSLTEATLKELALEKGITKSVEAMTEAEKAQLRYIAIVETATSNNVINDFARTLESPANAMRILKQQVTQLGRAIGSVFIPIISQVIPYVLAFTKILTSAIKSLATLVGFKMPDWTNKDWSAGVGGVSDVAEDTANKLGGAGKKAKELKKALMGFDELNVLPSPTEPSSGGASGGISGGGDLGLDISSVWDEETFGLIDSQISSITDSIKNLNFASIVDTLVNGIITYAPKVLGVANDIVTWLYEAILTGLPLLVDGGIKLIQWLGEGLVEGIPNFLSQGLDMLDGFADMLTREVPKLVKNGMEFISNIVKGLMNSLPVFIEKAPEIVSKFANLINDNAPTVFKAGFGIIIDIAKGIVSAVPTLLANIPEIVMAIFNVWSAFNWLDLGKQALNLVSKGIKAIGDLIPTYVSGLKDKIVNVFKNLSTTLGGTNPIKGMWNLIVNFYKSSIAPKLSVSYWVDKFSGMKEAFPKVIKNMLNTGIDLFNSFIGWLNSRLKFSWNGLSIAGKKIFDGGSVQLFRIPTITQRFEDGGFIEDGLFTMNKGEIAGQFDNGKSVVANNYQITEGISKAVYEAITRASGFGSKDITLNATFEVDGDTLGKKVIKYHNGIVNQTGESPLTI